MSGMTEKQRAEARRAEKLAAVQEQIDAGTLVVTWMTAKERAEHPARPRPARGPGSRDYR
jgi:hypothetical protein